MSALLAFVHSLLTTIPSLCTSLSSYLSTIISMTIITYPIAQQPILSPTWSQLQHSLQLLHHLADPLGDLIAHIGHLYTSLPLQVGVSNTILMTTINSKLPYWHHQLVLSWYHHQPESHQQSLNQRSWSDRHVDNGTHRPDSRDTWVR